MIQTDVAISAERYTDETQDILRCLKILYGTSVGEQALDRDFGVDWSFIDRPLPVAKARIEAELILKTQKYEPRAEVDHVQWDTDAVSGGLKPKVVLK